MKPWKLLLISFVCLIIVKSLLVSLVPAPSMFSDEYEYAKMAQSFWYEHNVNVHDVQSNAYPPLYAIVISISYALNDMRIVYLAMKILNVILTSLAIFPAYLLARKLMDEKTAFASALIVGLLPGAFSFAPFIMSENLFFPLSMFAIYFLYKTITEKSWLSGLLAGIFAALAFFTRTMGIAIIATIFLYALVSLFNALFLKKRANMKLLAALILSLAGLFAVWIAKNAIIISPLLQQYSSPPHVPPEYSIMQSAALFIFWLVVYFSYMTIATGFFPMLNILNRKNYENTKPFFILLGVVLAISLIIVARQNMTSALLGTTIFNLTGRPIGRYLEFLFPLIIIGGFASFGRTRLKKTVSYSLIAICIVSLIILSSFVLLPVNNEALSIIGGLKVAYEHLFGTINLLSAGYFLFSALIAILLTFAIRAILINRNKKYALISILAIFFIATNILNYIIVMENSREYWYEGEQMQLGLWINDRKEFADKTFLIDERDEGKIMKTNQESLYEKGTDALPGASTIMGFWLNNPIKIRNVNDLQGIDYVLSKHQLDLPIVKQTEGNIYLYKVPKEIIK